jgi:hypothetical protein
MKKRIKKPYLAKVIKESCFVIIFLLGFCNESPCSDHVKCGTEKSSHNNSSIQQLSFSPSNHSYERNLVMKHERIRLKTGRIYIALVDLNDDGTKEIISYIESAYYCGQETGCPLNIYRIVNGKLIPLLMSSFKDGFPMVIDIDKTGKQNVIGIIKSRTMGWNDILIDGDTVWKWHGKFYKR